MLEVSVAYTGHQRQKEYKIACWALNATLLESEGRKESSVPGDKAIGVVEYQIQAGRGFTI